MDLRRVFLFFHFFKNAGSTIDWILEKNFGSGFATLNASYERERILQSEVLDYLKTHSHIKALSSHNFRWPPPRDPHIDIIEICSFRNPIDRIESIYRFYLRADEPKNATAAKARGSSSSQFVEWYIRNQVFNCANCQTCFLALGSNYLFPPSQQHLEAAVSALREIPLLLIVHRLEESLAAAEFFLRAVFPKLDLSYVSQNVSSERSPHMEERLVEIEKCWGSKLFKEVLRLNALDLKLLEEANEELNRRISFVPDFEGRLADFRLRCETNLTQANIYPKRSFLKRVSARVKSCLSSRFL